jgi:enoyl-CoA hydratase/carnithine racemase
MAEPSDSAPTVPAAELVHLDRRADGVAVITLDRPKVNSLSLALLSQLRGVAEGLHRDPPGAVVITGGARIFAAGAEIAEFGGPVEAAHIGGQFGQPEILLGIIPGGGGTQRWARLVGPARAKDLILTGRQVDADEALAMGLVDRVVEPAELLDAAIAYGAELAAGALVAQGLAKQAIDRGLETDLATGLQIEQEAFVEVFRTEDSQIGTRSFLENGPGQATFTGR